MGGGGLAAGQAEGYGSEGTARLGPAGQKCVVPGVALLGEKNEAATSDGCDGCVQVMDSKRPGDVVSIQVRRGGGTVTKTITLGERVLGQAE